jgi:hypothetical protein
MMPLSGIIRDHCPASAGISVRLHAESLSGIIGIRKPARGQAAAIHGKAAAPKLPGVKYELAGGKARKPG